MFTRIYKPRGYVRFNAFVWRFVNIPELQWPIVAFITAGLA
jgi:hypothetical protein